MAVSSLVRALGLLAFFAFSLLGCERKLPPMVDVFEVGPRTVERHERIEIHGAGFPPGRRAEVSFRGAMSAPGERPARVDIVTEGKVTSDETIAVLFDEVLEHRFAGRGGALRHGTFHGAVEVRFTALGGANVYGARDGVDLDVRPKAIVDPAADERGQDALAKLGATLAEGETQVLGALAPGGVAEQYGLLAGDRIVEFAGVRVHGVSDIAETNVPRPLVVRYLRAGESDERSVSIDAPPFPRVLPTWLTLGVLGFAMLSLVLGLFVSRRLTFVRRWEIALGAMLREQATQVRSKTAPTPATGRRAVPWSWIPSLLLAAALSIVPLVPAFAELDVPTLFVAWLAARLVLVRPRDARVKHVFGLVSWLTEAFASITPLAVVVVLGVHQTAALRLVDISAAQGSWRWMVWQAPWMTVASCAALVTFGKSVPGAMRRLADTLGFALLVLVAFGGWEPAHGGAFGISWMVPFAFVCKLVFVMAVSRGLAVWAERAGSRSRGDGASGLAACACLLTVAGHFVFGTPGWLAEWLAPSLLVLVAVASGVLLSRSLGVPPGTADELDPA